MCFCFFELGPLNSILNGILGIPQVCEEGMDVPEANCVVRFDPMLTSVSYVQGRGRAREAGSSLLVLREREDLYILQRGVQWKQGVVIYMTLCTSLLYDTTPIHCTPLPLHPPVMNTQDRPTALLADVERQQQAIIASFDAKKTAAGASDAERAAEVAAQTER